VYGSFSESLIDSLRLNISGSSVRDTGFIGEAVTAETGGLGRLRDRRVATEGRRLRLGGAVEVVVARDGDDELRDRGG